MASVSIYLNFQGNTEEAFNHYKKVFRTEFSTPVMRFKDVPPGDAAPPIPDAEKKQSNACVITLAWRHTINGNRHAGKYGP